MKFFVLYSTKKHPIFELLIDWCDGKKDAHELELGQKAKVLLGRALLLLISCNEKVTLSD